MSGVKGKSGRKKYEIEKADYKDLLNLFYAKTNVEKLKQRISKGLYNSRDYLHYELLTSTGKEARQTLLKKIFPEQMLSEITIKKDFEGIKLDI